MCGYECLVMDMMITNIQAYLRDTEYSVPDHCNKVHIVIRRIT